MNLDEAIRHCEEVAWQNEEDAIVYSNCKKYKTNLYEIGLAENAEKKCCKCAEEHRQLAEWLKELKEYKEQSGDAISRDKVIVQLSHLLSDWDDDWNVGIRKCIETVKSVESATPQQKTERWIAQDIHNCHTSFKCSECGYIHSFMHLYGKPTADYTYCPNCGVKMIEPQESEVKE